MVTETNNEDSFLFIQDTAGQNFTKKLLFNIQIVEADIFQKIKETVIVALKDSLRCVDIHQTIIDEDDGRINFYEKISTVPDELLSFEESVEPSNVQVQNVSYETIGTKLTGEEDDQVPAVEDMGKMSCFNCDGNHTLRECPLPRDVKRINRSRNSMKEKTGNRYHLTIDNKYAKFKPGRISDELKVALGLNRKSLPLHIYRMRVCGYPTAWLKEAEVTKSGLSMIHTEECVQKSKEDNNMNSVMYDIEQIIDFPGFNTACGDDFIDESRRYGLPPMVDNHSKENFIKMLQLNAELTRIQKEDLDERKKLQEFENNLTDLQEAEETLNESVPNESLEIEEELETTNPNLSASLDVSSCENRSTAILTVEGTPVLNSISPFSTLPKRENFSVGVSDVIAFENLPDSTGKYEKMRDTLNKVRKTLLKDMK